MVRTIGQVLPKEELEPDREIWKPGRVIGIIWISITDKTRFEKLAKINGEDPVTKKLVKVRTTSGPVVEKLQGILDSTCNPDGTVRGEPVLAKMIEKTSGNSDPKTKKPLKYQDLADPGS